MSKRYLPTIAIIALLFILICPEIDANTTPTQIKRSRARNQPAAKLRQKRGYIGETEKNLTAVAGVRRKMSNRKKVKKNQDIEVENDETHRTRNRRFRQRF